MSPHGLRRVLLVVRSERDRGRRCRQDGHRDVMALGLEVVVIAEQGSGIGNGCSETIATNQ